MRPERNRHSAFAVPSVRTCSGMLMLCPTKEVARPYWPDGPQSALPGFLRRSGQRTILGVLRGLEIMLLTTTWRRPNGSLPQRTTALSHFKRLSLFRYRITNTGQTSAVYIHLQQPWIVVRNMVCRTRCRRLLPTAIPLPAVARESECRPHRPIDSAGDRQSPLRQAMQPLYPG